VLPILALGAAVRTLRINLTGSIPVGVYRVMGAPPARGAIVLACLPPGIAELARRRAYVPRGRCPAGTAPVGKMVLAVAADTVSVTPAGVRLNGRVVPNTRPLARDGRGRPLPVVPAVPHVLRPGEMWLVATHSPRSFDSRYFGAIEMASVLAVVRPVWTAARHPLP
jgi:conjugative transfer signal peptidase TraF